MTDWFMLALDAFLPSVTAAGHVGGVAKGMQENPIGCDIMAGAYH